jgi:hypothetical protein
VIGLPAFLVLLVVLVAFGDRVAKLLGLWPGPLLERLSLAWVLSTGVVTLGVFGLAASGGVSRWSCLALVAALGMASIGCLRELWGELRRVTWRETLWPAGRLDRAMMALTGLFLAGGFVMALAPPTGMDTGIYHFTIPKVIVQHRGLVPRDDIWIHKSGGFYMVYVLGMALGGEIVAKLLAFATAAAGAGLCASVAERLRPRTGRLAIFILLSTPVSVGYLGYEYLELPILTYVLAALLAILRASEARAWTLLACGVTGLAISAKPSAFAAGILAPAALGLMLRRDRARALPAAIGAAALFAATAGFWSLWNYATTGALVHRYPYTAVEGGGEQVPVTWWVDAGHQLSVLATLGVYWTDSAGPLIPAGLAGFALFLWKRENKLAFLLWGASVAGYIGLLAVAAPVYLRSDFGARYLAPCMLGFGAPVAAQFVGWALERPGLLRRAVLLALLLPAAPLLVLKGGKAAVSAPAALGLESRSAYLEKKIETFAACEVLNRLPDPDVKVLFAAVRPYYLDRPFVWVPYVGPNPFTRDLKTGDDFIRRIRELKITHVLLEPGGFSGAPFVEADALSRPMFREIGRWPWKTDQWVRLYAVAPQ